MFSKDYICSTNFVKQPSFLYRKLMWKKEFDTSYVGFMKDGAQWLVDNTDIKLVGKYLKQIHPWCAFNNLYIKFTKYFFYQ